MITLHFIAADGRATEAKGKPGKSLMEAAVSAGIDGIAADCGGLLTCATCHVHVREPYASSLPPPAGTPAAAQGGGCIYPKQDRAYRHG